MINAAALIWLYEVPSDTNLEDSQKTTIAPADQGIYCWRLQVFLMRITVVKESATSGNFKVQR